MEKLAVNGGEPVRKKPFPTNYLGVSLYGEEEMRELADVIRSKSPFRHYGIGTPQKVEHFEAKARAYFGRKHALATSSGTGALFCAVAALGIGPGDEVILPAFGWYSNFYAITHVGALPVFADVDDTLGLDPADFQRKITAKTKAVMVVDFQGCPAKMDEIMEIAKARGVKVIEDVAQAIGGSYNGKKLASFGDFGMVSFQQNKILCSGEGGLLMTDDDALFARAVRYQDLGMIRPVFEAEIEDKSLLLPEAAITGAQFRMSEFQGAVLNAQMDKLEGILAVTRKYHARMREALKDNPHFKLRYVEGDCGITLSMLFPTVAEGAEFQRCLKAEGLPMGAKSACKNMMSIPPISTKRLPNAAMPPFGAGCPGEHIDYIALTKQMKVDDIAGRYVATSIGPQYTEDDISDIIRAIQKVDENLYGQR